jgi:Mor family transcriptional regulator
MMPKNEHGLTYLQCLGIRTLREAGWTYKELAEHYEVTARVIREVCKREKLNYPEFYGL